MPGIQSVEKSPRFGAAHFTNNDPVGSVPENSFQQVIESDRALVRIELGLGGDDVRFADDKLCRVFNDQNPILVGNGIGENVYECGLAGACSTGYQDIVATLDGIMEFLREFWRNELLGRSGRPS